MKLVFAGTPEFAAAALAALIDAGHEIVLVLTQPDRPAGRGLQVHPSPVKSLAAGHGIVVIQPAGLRLGGRHDAEARAAHATLEATPHEAMVVAAYGLILPASILAIPPLGCINIHASLLPRWRGAAPIQRAIEAGDAETGITIMQMDEGLDTGAVLSTRSLAILPADTGGTLTDRLARLGGEAIVEALPSIAAGTLLPRAQHPVGDASAVTYASKLTKAEAALDFTATARELVDRIRAFDPWPGCSAALHVAGAEDSPVHKVWRAETVSAIAAEALGLVDGAARLPGTVMAFVDDGEGAVIVSCADGVVALTQLQKAGGKRLPARAFARDFATLTVAGRP